MQLTVNGLSVYAGTGGRDFDAAKPALVFLHGAGFDHTVWALLARWFAYHGWSVLAVDLPGHGRSSGAALETIEAMADWTAALIAASGASKAAIVGHSMGALVALETAARHPARVSAIGLVAAAAAMPVSPDLLAAANAGDHAAIDMVAIWGHGYRATLGGSLAAGSWMLGGGERLLEQAPAGALSKDLIACSNYRNGLVAAAKVTGPAILVLGERDMMTPAKGGKALGAALPNAQVTMLKGAGHMLMSERPDEVLDALRGLTMISVG